MKITIQDLPAGEEEEIILRCRKVDNRLMRLISAFKAGQEKITAFREGAWSQLDPGDIYYFESVDNKIFAYLEQEVYETRFKLYELEERLAWSDFFRASKSTIINLSKIKRLSPAFNGRFEAELKNGEHLVISRQYVPGLKEKLGL